MEGVKLPETHVEITFGEDTKFPGVVVLVSLDVPADMFFDMMEHDDSDEVPELPDGATKEEKRKHSRVVAKRAKEQRELYTRFGDVALVEWNVLDRRGEPIPADGPGLMSQPFPFIAIVISKWADAVQVADDDPLVEESDNSEPSPVVFALTGA